MGSSSPSRRAVVRAGAWTVPAVATVAAAPAFAASVANCAQQTVNWGSVNGRKATTLTSTGTPIPTTLTVAAAGNTNTTANLTGSTRAQGGVTPNLLIQFDNDVSPAQPTETVTFTFVPPVIDLTYTILDIDSSANTGPTAGDGRYYDYVSLSPGFTITSQPATVVGNGTTDPFHYVNDNTRVENTANAGNVTVNYPGPVSSVTLTYFSGNSGATPVPLTAAQMIVALSNFTFKRSGC